MRIVYFTHSLRSDWNHGNAHFLRGVVSELIERGHEVKVYEPENSWSRGNLIEDAGETADTGFHNAYPSLASELYDPEEQELEEKLRGADLVIVHEWNDHELVSNIGQVRRQTGSFKLLFHDTHHRSVTEESSMAEYDLSNYDGVLAFGEVIRQRYLEKGWAKRAWTWHEAADPNVFHPIQAEKEGDLVWIGNWGDEERTAELHEFLLGPVKRLGLKAKVYGVRYPQHAINALHDARIEYGGYLPNYKAPDVFAKYKLTVHVPRRPYVKALPGIPTIRVFEALACGIPLVSAPWNDAEGLFTPGKDFLFAQDGTEMEQTIKRLLNSPDERTALAEHGLQTILNRHTCAHRVDELLLIADELNSAPREMTTTR